jgi:hypothetical protein
MSPCRRLKLLDARAAALYQNAKNHYEQNTGNNPNQINAVHFEIPSPWDGWVACWLRASAFKPGLRGLGGGEI